ncbi:MAG: hypothetical protein LBS90_06385, partial [Oscillospiraceae bacterium]|nr:hypothetical protein [Oscillospiraceae bacterium]
MDETDKISVGRGAEEAPDASETPGTAVGAQLEESARETAPADESDCAEAGGEDGGEWDEAAADDAPDEWDAEPDGGSESPAQPGVERFVLKYLGETFEVSRDELIRLAQKGRDYDRIRGRAESLAGRLGGAERANEALG